MKNQTIKAIVLEAVEEAVDFPKKESEMMLTNGKDNLKNDFAMDSLDTADLAIKIEAKFAKEGVTIDLYSQDKVFTTLSNVINFLISEYGERVDPAV